MAADESPTRPSPLYPPLQPYASGHLDVGDHHQIWWEACGNPQGKPALFVHGGPGGGFYSDHRRLFDPARYNIVLFDQRGAGRSLPQGELQANTTDHLVADIEALRTMLGVERWMVLGGSWGAALALTYALRHPAHVSGLVLRGVFTGRRCEVDWLYREGGASALFPEGFERFIAPVPPAERDDPVAAYHRRLTGADIEDRRAAARTWCGWEGELLTLRPRRRGSWTAGPGEVALARIEAHYFVHDCFLRESEILDAAPSLAGMPGIIVQGRYDVVTPARTAHALHKLWPGSQLRIVDDAGHATSEPGVLAALVTAANEMAG